MKTPGKCLSYIIIIERNLPNMELSFTDGIYFRCTVVIFIFQVNNCIISTRKCNCSKYIPNKHSSLLCNAFKFEWSQIKTSHTFHCHCSDVIMNAMASQITGFSIVYSTLCLGADHWNNQSSASLAFVRGIPRWLANSPHKGQETQRMVPLDDVIMCDWNNGRTWFDK